jgi:hypothetical protein
MNAAIMSAMTRKERICGVVIDAFFQRRPSTHVPVLVYDLKGLVNRES